MELPQQLTGMKSVQKLQVSPVEGYWCRASYGTHQNIRHMAATLIDNLDPSGNLLSGHSFRMDMLAVEAVPKVWWRSFWKCGGHLPFSPDSTLFLASILWFCHLQFPAGMWKHVLKEGAHSTPKTLKTLYLKNINYWSSRFWPDYSLQDCSLKTSHEQISQKQMQISL